jgi:AraC family transcriptional regulator
VSYAVVTAEPGSTGFLGAPGAVGAIGDYKLPARRMEVRRIDTPTVTAMIIDLDRDFSVSGNWYSPDVHYFDMSLIPRPAASMGRFADVFDEHLTYGKVFVAPAGYRLNGLGADGPQNSLNVFVRAHPLFPDEAVLGDDLAPLLKDCLRFRSDAVRQILERIAAEVLAPRFASDVMVEGLGLTLLAEAGRRLEATVETLSRKGGLPLWRIKRIEERIRDGIGPVTTAELADLCGLSRRQLTRAFREETGRTITTFVQELTVERAKRLLSDSGLSIAEIAGQIGFATPAAFSAAFRRETGVTPRAFRARSPIVLPRRLG